MYNKNIKLFSIEGELGSERALAKTRGGMERILDTDLRDKGYLPVLDLGSGFFTQYDKDRDSYRFLVTMYGIYVGKRKAQEWEGYLMGRLLPHHKSAKSYSR